MQREVKPFHLGMAGLSNLPGLYSRMELEVETLIDNKHRKWFLMSNGEPVKAPIIHIDGNNVAGLLSGPQVGFNSLALRYLYRENYPHVVVHGKSPDPLPNGWKVEASQFDPINYDKTFFYHDAEDAQIQSLVNRAPEKALIAYNRKAIVGLPNPIPESKDPEIYAKYAKAAAPNTYVGVIGSREGVPYKAVYEFVTNLPKSCILVSGGAQGVDTYAREAGEAAGLQFIEFPANWIQVPKYPNPNFKPKLSPPERTVEFSNERSNAGPERNEVLVDECNSIYAFIDGGMKNGSPGSIHAVHYAALEFKDARVFDTNPKTRDIAEEPRWEGGRIDLFFIETPGDFQSYI